LFLLNYHRNFTFENVHVDGTRALAEACVENGVARFVQVSALNASEDSPSKFLRTKVNGCLKKMCF
jgi:NADH dehydrogenase (ubiquinone) 1 alpha subcomplex subunit 9